MNVTETRNEAIQRRRTVAVVAHPDAGKTTLTEKLLLYAGAIHRAGSVKARRADSHATSDWMDLEKERGISITSSVLQFDYEGFYINLLDTPGHADFSADTYRTLVAADSAVVIIDGTSGIERQTRKLFQLSRNHEIPFFVFVNKMDRFTRDPLELFDEMEQELGAQMVPFTWPLGRGKHFAGLHDRVDNRAILYDDASDHGQKRIDHTRLSPDNSEVRERLGDERYQQYRETVELLDVDAPEFDESAFRGGRQVPVFFGSAQTNAGVEPFLNNLVELAPPPQPRGGVEPTSEEFTGFVFKIQANMDPNHRDRIAFVRICSGRYEADMRARIVRTGEKVRLSQTRKFMGREREVVEEAFAGDVVGLYDPGEFHVGDTLTQGSHQRYDAVPRFSPEHFARVRVEDAFRRKHLHQGLEELSEEGAVQLFHPWQRGQKDVIVGVVGELQFEVLEYRLEEEYGVDVRLDPLPYHHARWIEGEDLPLSEFDRGRYRKLLVDRDDHPILLFKTDLSLRREVDDHPDVSYHDTAPLFREETMSPG